MLVVGEAPGADEDEEGIQFVGKVGKEFRRVLDKIDIDLDLDCWKINAVNCRPPGNKMHPKYIECCRPMVFNAIEVLKPDVIVLVGAAAVQSVVGRLWREDVGSIGRWIGWRIPCQDLNAWICPTWHPSYVVRLNDQTVSLIFGHHLENALELRGKPWEELPNWEKQIDCHLSPDDAAEIIADIGKRDGRISFDFETDRLKPDRSEARIVSCAICWEGRYTIAYPWQEPAISKTSEVLLGDQPKYGANIKFEQRWAKRLLGHGVRRWKHDCMQAAHILDNRPAITSVKFQAFVQLGQKPWDERVAPFLKAKDSNSPNRIDEVSWQDLLKYNGMDAVVEFKLAEKQMELMK